MNTQVSVFNRRRQMVLAIDAIGDLGGMMPPHVSTRGNRFALVDAAGLRYPVQTLYLDVVIIDANPHKSKIYWGDEPFDPNAVEFIPPVCFSDNGTAPSANAQEKQARTCAECRHNEWSKVNEVTGNRNKPCSDRKKLAVLVLGDTAGLVYQLQVPPATLKALVHYTGQLQAAKPPGLDRKADLNDVVTRISFVDNKNGEMQFAPVAWISSVQAGQAGGWAISLDQQGRALTAPDGGAGFSTFLDDTIDAGVTDSIVGKLDRPWTGPALPAPQQAQPQQLQGPVQPQPMQQVAPPLSAPSAAGRAPEPAPVPSQATAPSPSEPQGGAPQRGGRRPGSGRPRKDAQPAAAALQPPAGLQGELIPPGAQQQAPAQPIPLQMAPEEVLRPPAGAPPPPAAPSSSAFAQPQDMTSQLDETLEFAMGLNTRGRG